MSGEMPRVAGLMVAVVGPSGSGKSSLCDALLRDEGPLMALSISATSRAPREGERNGLHYFFLSKQEFEEKREAGYFFEWEEVHGHYYGTPREMIEPALRGERDVLLDVDIKGALHFKSVYPNNVVIVFVVAPSQEEMVERICKRAAMNPAELQKRLRTAQGEYHTFLAAPSGMIDYLIVNADFNRSKQALQSIVRAERCRTARVDKEDIKNILAIRDIG